MLVIGTFPHSIELEQALTVMEHSGIIRKYILVVLMDIEPNNPTQFMSKEHDLYSKSIEVGIACGTATSVVGASIGFVLKWGPVVWCLIFAFSGFAVGFGTSLFTKRGIRRNLPKILPEVTVIVQCHENQSIMVMETMWKYGALTVGRTREPS